MKNGRVILNLAHGGARVAMRALCIIYIILVGIVVPILLNVVKCILSSNATFLHELSSSKDHNLTDDVRGLMPNLSRSYTRWLFTCQADEIIAAKMPVKLLLSFMWKKRLRTILMLR